jgi:hypothetical protein
LISSLDLLKFDKKEIEIIGNSERIKKKKTKVDNNVHFEKERSQILHENARVIDYFENENILYRNYLHGYVN